MREEVAEGFDRELVVIVHMGSIKVPSKSCKPGKEFELECKP